MPNRPHIDTNIDCNIAPISSESAADAVDDSGKKFFLKLYLSEK